MDKAIVFSINNDYCFALANVLMSLEDNSEYIYNTSDFFVYHDGISYENQQLLKKLCKNIYFINFTQDSKLPLEIYNHPHMNRWGKFIYQKLNCFELLFKYEHVLWLDADILVNGTLLGMKPKEDTTVISDTTMFHEGLVVADVVYNPEETKFLREAKEHGCITVPGKGMLLWQGVASFKLFTGKDMPVDEVKERFFQGV